MKIEGMLQKGRGMDVGQPGPANVWSEEPREARQCRPLGPTLRDCPWGFLSPTLAGPGPLS